MMAGLVHAAVVAPAAVVPAAVNLIVECRLAAAQGPSRSFVLGFREEWVSKLNPSRAVLLDPTAMLKGFVPTKVRIAESMVPGSRHSVEFGGASGTAVLSLDAIETGAFNAELSVPGQPSRDLKGQCFLIDGPIATYTFKRRARGIWKK